ncbi:hypothetical protein [Sedimenticola sp.]|uniref:hypothetical protein n=1 Tax=Sedimenticola sp. TaxID=1940285 RepID=UPI003D13ED31
MKFSTTLFAIAFVSIMSAGVALADDVGHDWLYGSGSELTKVDFSQMPATAAGRDTHMTSMEEIGQVNAIPDYLEGLDSNQ